MTLDRTAARSDAEKYLAGTQPYGYPAYDAFEAGAGPWSLSDGDFLAPALLNVTVRVRAFYSLAAARGRLEAWLARVPSDARLIDASQDEVDLLGELFGVLDEGLPGVGGTILAKIMHRKRPAFLPLYDRYIWWCYVGVDGAPIRRDRHRTWAEFMPLLAAAMKNDLEREGVWLTQVASLATGPVPITALRALDIIAWQGGRNLNLIDVASQYDVTEAEAEAE